MPGMAGAVPGIFAPGNMAQFNQEQLYAELNLIAVPGPVQPCDLLTGHWADLNQNRY